MAKNSSKNENAKTGVVPVDVGRKQAEGMGDAGLCSCKYEDQLFQAYLFMLSAVDWSRDLRKKKTICSDCLKDARLAVEVFEQETKTEK